MKVSELIKFLEKQDKDQDVYVKFFGRVVKANRVSDKLIPDKGNFRKITLIE